ncbi:MAG: peptidoglycan DD-metalloendopeptidase family protein, partial [Ruminococcus sp.]
SEVLKEKFDLSYVQYSQRAKAMYVSGNMTLLEALLTSDDISTLMTRIEMVRRVSKQDKELLDTLQTQGRKLDKAQKELSNKKDSLSNNQQALVATQQTLTQTVKDLEKKQASFSDMQSDYESEKKEADALLIKIQQDTQTYSEFRHQDQAELDAINREIEEAAEKYLQQIEEQNRTTTTTTTTPTTKPHSSSEGGSSSGTTTTTKPTTTKTTTASSGKLQMTYPVPSQTKITTGYGSAGYAGHTGVDFACASGSNVVAAESGTVIISKDLTNSDGSYRSYGRYIVIAHDKKNSSGNYVYTLYAHNSSRVVSEGQYVKKGQLIAYSGSTGNSTGPHCHFEVRTPTASYSDCVNPTNYLP